MSKFRTKKDAQKVLGVRPQGRGPNGRNLCRFCNCEVPPRRRSFCSPACVHEWKVRSDTRYARRCVRKRDKGICALCGLDCLALQREIRSLPLFQRKAKAEEYGIPKHRVMKSLWDCDHIVPVAEGGGECGLYNLRTLCLPCHIIVTAELKERLASKRKANRSKIAKRMMTNYLTMEGK